MPKNPIVPMIASLVEAVNKIPPPETNETSPTYSELGRIADALERIATALEKLTAQEAPAFTEIKDNNQDRYKTPSQNYDTLTLPIPQPAIPTQPAAPPKNKPAKKAKLPANSSNASKPPASAVTNNGNSLLLEHLKKQSIKVRGQPKKATPEKLAYQGKLVQLALFLGQNFTDCKELYQQLKANMIAPRKTFSYSLIGATAEQNRLIRQYCQLLKEADLMEEFTYQGKPDFNIQLKASGKEQKFLSGAWLEYYVKSEVDKIVKPYAEQTQQLYEVLPNLEIIFKDNSKAELDLLFALGPSIYCVEAKTRPGLANLKTFQNKIKPLGLETKSVMVVVLDKSEEECLKLSKALGNMPIIRLDRLEETLKDLLKLPK